MVAPAEHQENIMSNEIRELNYHEVDFVTGGAHPNDPKFEALVVGVAKACQTFANWLSGSHSSSKDYGSGTCNTDGTYSE